MRGEVVPTITSGNHPGQGRFVFKQQRLVAREEIHAGEITDGNSRQRFHELNGIAQLLDHLLVLGGIR